jgi:hypothetical protein
MSRFAAIVPVLIGLEGRFGTWRIWRRWSSKRWWRRRRRLHVMVNIFLIRVSTSWGKLYWTLSFPDECSWRTVNSL